MKAIYFIVLAAALVGCEGSRMAVQHAKPNSAHVARPLAQTRVAISQTRAAVSQANASASKAVEAGEGIFRHATELARTATKVAERGLAAKSTEAKALAQRAVTLAHEVDALKSDLFRVTVQLREAENAAEEADARNAEAERRLVAFDALVAEQTATLNGLEISLASARAEKELAIEAQKEAEGKLRALRLKVAAWVAVIVLLMAGGFYFKLLRFGV